MLSYFDIDKEIDPSLFVEFSYVDKIFNLYPLK
jgi:hypothetical protein